MAVVNKINVRGSYNPDHFNFNGANLQISFKRTSIRQNHDQLSNNTSITQIPPNQQPTTVFIPYDALGCRSCISNLLSSIPLELSPTTLDLLTAEVVATTANSAVNFIQAVLQLVEKADDDGDDDYDVPQLIKFHNDDGIYLPLTESARVSGTCSICLMDFSKAGRHGGGGIEEIGLFDCNHVFHSNCINQWLNQHNSCPLCRRPLLT